MMSAADIIEALDKIGFDRVDFMQSVLDYAVDRGLKEIDINEVTDKLIHIADEKGIIKPWMDELIALLGPDNAHDLLLKAVQDEVEKWLKENDLQQMVDDWLDKPEEPEPPAPPPVPPSPKPKMRKFEPVGDPVKLLSGHDNGVTTVVSNGRVCLITGDGFVGNTKYETSIFYLPSGDDPMNRLSWKFLKGTSGKCYGAIVFKNELILAQSDKGSGYVGSQNCRLWNVNTNKRSSKTLQSLHSKGVHWFIVQKGPGYQNSYQTDTIDIGCVSFAGEGHAAHNKNFRTPVKMWRGDPANIDSFKYLGELQGVKGQRNNWATTCSVTYIYDRKQPITVLGDWTISENQYFISQADNVLGPYSYIGNDRFKPPMIRKRSNGQWSGVFTGNYFKRGNQWYEMLSGHRADLAIEDDSVWIRKVRAVI